MIEKRRFRAENGTELPYLLYAPEERGDGPLPMIFYLHGAGSRGKDLSQLRRNGLSGMILGGEFHGRCIVAAPQCPEEGVWLHYIRELGELADFSAAESGADPDRIALTGMSMGGFGPGSWRRTGRSGSAVWRRFAAGECPGRLPGWRICPSGPFTAGRTTWSRRCTAG